MKRLHLLRREGAELVDAGVESAARRDRGRGRREKRIVAQRARTGPTAADAAKVDASIAEVEVDALGRLAMRKSAGWGGTA